ncbi:DUF1248 domain-containing protein [Caenorhabditis elegans]|uniref:DUF1248 domain-containing protein n=1 Tax=Caenorhabditis elegans TaxID=6239 RepID=O02226_CAEEL|nr:DUF1248 domain-containing protein [Caenorhabditis elegans]CAB05128.2 DUF1248 domain-containing protein [Caenorhabditis elegans]|eukprot:NP_501735.1 Uncharacterized protein CELE_C28D4.4 [Caenorhabditis elegans]
MLSKSLAIGRKLTKISSSVKSISSITFKTVDGKPRDALTIHNVDFVIDPDEKMVDEYMKVYGNQRLNFKRNDIDIWRKSFKDSYSLWLVCLKGTNKIVQMSHVLNFPPLPSHNDILHQYHGFFWIDPDYRGKDSMEIMDYIEKLRARNQSDNNVGTYLPPAANMIKKIYGTNNYQHIMYVSYYKPDEMQIPEDLNLDGIFLKNATEVPDMDIVKYDNTVFPYERSKYMLNLLRDPEGFGKVAYDNNGKVIGFGNVIIYPSGECVLTPLYADDSKVAQAIFKSILKEIPLNGKKEHRFQIRSIDQCDGGFEWIQPFVRRPIRKEIMGYMCGIPHHPTVNYKKTYSNTPYTTCAI